MSICRHGTQSAGGQVELRTDGSWGCDIRPSVDESSCPSRQGRAKALYNDPSNSLQLMYHLSYASSSCALPLSMGSIPQPACPHPDLSPKASSLVIWTIPLTQASSSSP